MLKVLNTVCILLIYCSCNTQRPADMTIYSSGGDSIFYFEGNKFDPGKLVKGKKSDSLFFKDLVRKIAGSKRRIFYKPLYGNSGGGMGSMLDMVKLFLRKDMPTLEFTSLDSTEKNYFNDVDIWGTRFLPPPVLRVDAPTSVSSKIPSGEPVLFFRLTKNERLFYKYDSTGGDKNFIPISPVKTEKIVQIISDLEKRNNVQFNDNNILFIGDGSALYPVFKKLKDALKQKEIFKFKIVTTTDQL